MGVFKHFKWKEFDCKSGKGKGIDNMDQEFICLLDDAREIASIPFNITSGYRTPEYNMELINKGYKGSTASAHIKGIAADISTTDPKKRFKIVSALLEVGINRIGIGENFIHCDIDTNKPQNVMWNYY